MSFENYSELKTSIANWSDRHDLEDHIPDFIKLAESRFNRILRLRAMESKEFAYTVAGQANYSLPSRYIQMREFRLNNEPTVSLQYITPEVYESWNLGSGRPKYYTIIANELRLGPVPSGRYQMEMLFWKKFQSLSPTVASNWILENAPDIYLYGALLEMEPFIQNDQRVGLWKQGFDQAVGDLQLSDDKDRHSGSALMIRS